MDAARRERICGRLAVLAVLSAIGQTAAMPAALAATASGPMGLAIAGLLAPHSPQVGAHNQRTIALLLGGNANVAFPAGKKLSVTADQVTCRISNVDITMRSCKLDFGTHKRALKGRAANELFATLVAAGVMPEGAAGSIIASLSKLDCTLDPNEIKQKAGGGVQCTFDAGS